MFVDDCDYVLSIARLGQVRDSETVLGIDSKRFFNPPINVDQLRRFLAMLLAILSVLFLSLASCILNNFSAVLKNASSMVSLHRQEHTLLCRCSPAAVGSTRPPPVRSDSTEQEACSRLKLREKEKVKEEGFRRRVRREFSRKLFLKSCSSASGRRDRTSRGAASLSFPRAASSKQLPPTPDLDSENFHDTNAHIFREMALHARARNARIRTHSTVEGRLVHRMLVPVRENVFTLDCQMTEPDMVVDRVCRRQAVRTERALYGVALRNRHY